MRAVEVEQVALIPFQFDKVKPIPPCPRLSVRPVGMRATGRRREVVRYEGAFLEGIGELIRFDVDDGHKIGERNDSVAGFEGENDEGVFDPIRSRCFHGRVFSWRKRRSSGGCSSGGCVRASLDA